MNIEQIVAIVSPETAAEMAAQAEFNTKLIERLDGDINSLEAEIRDLETKRAALLTTKKEVSGPRLPPWAQILQRLDISEIRVSGTNVQVTSHECPCCIRSSGYWSELMSAIVDAGIQVTVLHEAVANGKSGDHYVKFFVWDGESEFDYETWGDEQHTHNFPIVPGILEWEPLPEN